MDPFYHPTRRGPLAFFLALAVVALVVSSSFLHTSQGQGSGSTTGITEPWIALDQFHPDVRPAGSVTAESILKFGHNGAVGTAALETVWSQGGLYVWPAGATAMTVSSDDANDTSAGTGARTVVVFALDSANLEIAPMTISMNGLTGVSVPTNPRAVNRMIVATAGSTGRNLGNVYIGTGTVTAGVPATIYGVIVASGATVGLEENQTQQGFFTVPADAVALVHSWDLSGTDDYTFRIKRRDFAGTYAGIWRVAFEGDANQFAPQILGHPIKFPAGDYETQVRSLGGPAIGVGTWINYDLWRGLP